MGAGESILHLSLFRCSQVQIHVICLLCKDGKDVELWQSGVLPPMWLENSLTGRHVCSGNCPLIVVTKLLRPMKSEMLVLEEVAEREVEVLT